MHIHGQYRSNQRLDGKKIQERMPDYVDALGSGDLVQIDKMITKYEKHDIQSFYIAGFVKDGDAETFKHLLEKGVLGCWEFESYIKRFYKADTRGNHDIFRLMIHHGDQSCATEHFLTAVLYDLPNVYEGDIRFILESINENISYGGQFANDAALSNLLARALEMLSWLSLTGSYGRYTDSEFYDLVDKRMLIVRYLWKNRDAFAKGSSGEAIRVVLDKIMEADAGDAPEASNTIERLGYLQERVKQLQTAIVDLRAG